jgi:hypothetical protein
MATLKWLGTGALMVALMAGMASTVAHAQKKPPHQGYACQAETYSGKPGIIQVAARSRKDAVAIASKTEATTFGGMSTATRSIVQCIRPSEEKFSDREFQRSFEQMDR